VTKLQSYLAGSVFALLLMANVAMELLNAFPANQYLWHLNLLFAREARPLLQHLDELASGGSAVTLVALGGLALVSIAAAHMRLRLVAAANCHVALVLMLFLGTRSYARSFPYGIPADDIVASLGASVSLVQLGIAAITLALAAACVRCHIDYVHGGFQLARRRSAGAPAHGRSAWRPTVGQGSALG
jgi:hypothetical protein